MSDEFAVTPAGTIDNYAGKVDVLVVGYGIAGACAALEARRAGGDVLIVERSSAGGGASALSSGIFYLGGGTAVQTACGFEDDSDNMYRYMTASMGVDDAAMIRRYCDDNVEHFDWLEAQGIPFERTYHDGKAVFLLSTECLLTTGNEKVWPYRDIAKPAPRGHQVAHPGEATGYLAMEKLKEQCASAGVEALFNAAVTSLVVDAEGAVVGASVRHEGAQHYYTARRGVVIATGGFAMNAEMTGEYLDLPETVTPLGDTYTTGDGVNLGMAAGAATEAMHEYIATASIYPPAQLIKGIIVNGEGRRFVAEDSYHGRTADLIAKQPQQAAYLIVDEEIFAYPEITTAEHRLIDGYETVEEMEQGLGVPSGALVATIERYNRNAAEQADPDFHKHRDWLKPLTAPFAAFDISFNKSLYLYMTLGGLKINSEAQVVNQEGVPIKNLFAAGACTAHIPRSGYSYCSGMSLGPGSYFGRVAGRNAMAG
jgi:3-oxo-5alpha-steroid 4-dehydrogenase